MAGWLYGRCPGRGQAEPGQAGREEQCIRPGCRAEPGGERTDRGWALRPGARGRAHHLEAGRKARMPREPFGEAPPLRCGAWEIPPRGMGVIKAWAVPLEKGGVRGGRIVPRTEGRSAANNLFLYIQKQRPGEGRVLKGRQVLSVLGFGVCGGGATEPLSTFGDPGQPLRWP